MEMYVDDIDPERGMAFVSFCGHPDHTYYAIMPPEGLEAGRRYKVTLELLPPREVTPEREAEIRRELDIALGGDDEPQEDD